MTTTKTFFATLAVFSLLLAACSSSRAGSFSLDHTPAVPYIVRDVLQETVSGKSAFNYFKDERILIGWNLGNTLDSYNDGIAGETSWGNPSANQEIMNGVKAAGFDIIRIPVTWMGSIGAAPDHLISAQRIRRVGDVVDMAHNAGLKVIINLHHDGSTPEYGRDHGWLSIYKSSKNQSDYQKITLQFARLWDQIAAYFKNYGDWLMFEPMNEIHDGGWGWSDEFKMFPAKQTDIINSWNQIFTDRVRAAGGNNTERYLLIPAYCTIPRQTLAETFALPQDSAENKLVVKFHYYDPHEFSIQGTRTAWGTQMDRQKVVEDFAPFKPRYIDNNIPVVIGESGAVMQLYPNDPAREALARQNRFDYTSHVFATAHRYGLVPIYWDNGSVRGTGEKFGLFDRRTGQPNSPESRALITAMVNAVR